jgi:Uma2 family endonuclease
MDYHPHGARRFTPDELHALSDGANYELVRGELVVRKTGAESSWVGGQLHLLLANHCKATGAGWVLPSDAGYQCFTDDPARVRKPDVSFVRFDRLPGLPEGHLRLAPDLAAEVVSSAESYCEVEDKVDEYLAAGVRLVWVVNPPNRSIRVHRPDGTVTDLRQADDLTGENVLPGFRCAVAELFSPPSPHGHPVAPRGADGN